MMTSAIAVRRLAARVRILGWLVAALCLTLVAAGLIASWGWKHRVPDELQVKALQTRHLRIVGTYGEKVLDAGSMSYADAAKAERAARLAKADLTTGVVGEFPELQGVMGRYYALEDGEDDDQALKRELRERLGTDVEVKSRMAHRVHHYQGYSVDLNLYQATISPGQEPSPLRVAEVRWVPSTEFEKYPFPAADQATTDLLLGFRR